MAGVPTKEGPNSAAVNRRDVVARLAASTPTLRDRFQVASLTLFGSAARDSLGQDSDVDVLVSFATRPDFDRYFALKFFLEDILRRPVDLATESMVGPRLHRRIEADMIRVG
ncbi:MAG: nucleotidyltransferase family protein [Thermoleophilia bacterium]